ncbi:MAG: ABC transporter permease [Pseudomonadota bacterium]|nr:ABC transporter permease [Pseudomonadota bacterium]
MTHAGTLLALVLLLGFNVALTRNFLSLQTLNVNLAQVTTIVIVGVGLTLVIATGGIDLSVGSLMAIAGTLAPLIFGKWPGATGLVLAITLPIAAAWCCGYFNGWLITRFKVQPIVATLVLFIAGRGIAQVLTGGQLQAFANPGFGVLGTGKLGGVPVQVWLMLVIVALASWILHRTVFGRYVVATGGSERAARLAGIPAARIKRHVYALGGALAGLAGLITVSINSSSDANLNGLGMELDAIAAVAVGGTLLSGGRATVLGTLLGALIIQLLRYTLLAHGVPDAAALVVKAGIIIAAVWVQRRHRS